MQHRRNAKNWIKVWKHGGVCVCPYHGARRGTCSAVLTPYYASRWPVIVTRRSVDYEEPGVPTTRLASDPLDEGLVSRRKMKRARGTRIVRGTSGMARFRCLPVLYARHVTRARSPLFEFMIAKRRKRFLLLLALCSYTRTGFRQVRFVRDDAPRLPGRGIHAKGRLG